MITREDFSTINSRIKEALEEALSALKTLSPANYVLFLADADYNKEYDTPGSVIPPYVVDNRVEGYKDETRLTFLTEFLNQFYQFPLGQEYVDDHPQRLNMELMIYTHIWESKPFLKKLFRLAELLNGESYGWKTTVPKSNKPDFISQKIAEKFQVNGFRLADIVTNGYHKSLRNAFAHSEYSFNLLNNNNHINLYNYKGKADELKTISFNDWSCRFAISALLSYHFLNSTYQKRTSLPVDLGTSIYIVPQPTIAGDLIDVSIEYRAEHNAFNYY